MCMRVHHFVVRNALLMREGGCALTLDPVEYRHPRYTSRPAEPAQWWLNDGEAVPQETGGRATEMRFDDDPGFRPGDYITQTVTVTPRYAGEFAATPEDTDTPAKAETAGREVTVDPESFIGVRPVRPGERQS